MEAPIVIVDSTQKLQELLDGIRAHDEGALSLYVDLEGDNLSRHGTIAILTMFVAPLRTVYLVDITTLGGSGFTTAATDGRSLGSILQSTKITKVFFDIRNDFDALFNLYGLRVAGIIDLQLMELAARGFSRRCINGLAKCIEKDAGLPYSDRQTWQRVKNNGKHLYSPELGGSYAVFAARPLASGLERYCAQDVALMPALFETYRPKLCDAWWTKINGETLARVALSQSASFNGKGRHMALGPHEWNSWRPGSGDSNVKTRSAGYAAPVVPTAERTTAWIEESGSVPVDTDGVDRLQVRGVSRGGGATRGRCGFARQADDRESVQSEQERAEDDDVEYYSDRDDGPYGPPSDNENGFGKDLTGK